MSQSTTAQTPDADLGIATFEGEPTEDAEILPLQNGSFPVVGIGGSAGAIPALQTFFREMPDEPGMAFVVILHLSPNYESNLDSILGNVTKMPVAQVTENIKFEINHVYVIPPTHLLTMHDGEIELAVLQREAGKRVAVDLFFRALAEAQEARAICIVLSGTNSDGSIGLKRVKERGGLTIAQDPDDAQYDEMPRNAIETGMVDWILPVAQMPARLMKLLRNEGKIHLPSIHPPAHANGSANGGANGDAETALRQILELLDASTGHNFIHYKRATVLRRIARRLQVNGLSDLPSYLDYLRANAGESLALLQDLLISVTNFFRDKTAFESLELLLPTLLRDKAEDEQIRVWVPGCATGEEAYSLAMMLAEYVDNHDASMKVQVFATDIDSGAIAFAREGLYPTSIVADVSPERLRRFFVPEQGRYRIRKDLRETVLFAAHNLLRDSPFSSLDLISCRNLLIYFGNEAQQRVFDTFHFASRPGGILMLGSSEAVGDSPLFAPLDKRNRIFERQDVQRASIALPMSHVPALPRRRDLPVYAPVLPAPAALGVPVAAPNAPQNDTDFSTFGELHLQLLEEYAPPSVLINEDYDIVHLSPSAGRFLQWSGGEVSINLLKVAPSGLRLELQTALFQALQSGQRVEVPQLSAPYEGQMRSMRLVVRPLHREGAGQNFLLVIFDLQAEPPQLMPIADEPVARRLEGELQHVRAQLKTTSRQHEASTEELKASNEELQAMNEELRSATEELETGKEELQSVNEELITVNAELKHKVEEVSLANSNLNNFMDSTEIATIFLDRAGCIRRYTPRAIDLFNLIPTDIGRPLADLRHKFSYEEWAKDAQKTLADLSAIEHEVRTLDGGWFLSRMLPYRTVDDRIDGVVLTFVDITARKTAEEATRASEESFRLLVAGVRDYAIFLFDEEGTITSWNRGVERTFGYRENEWVGRNWNILFPPDEREKCDEIMEQAREGNGVVMERYEVRADGSHFWASDATSALYDANCELRGYVKIVRDMTESRQSEDSLRAANEELESRVAQRTTELEELNDALKSENLERRQAEDGRLILVRQLEDELGRLKQLLQGIPAGVIIAHSDGRPLFVNTRARLTLSMPAGVEHDDAVRTWLYEGGSPLERALTGENVVGEERDFKRNDSTLSLSVSAEPIPNVLTSGESPISAAIVAFQDVTERKRAEVARQQLLQRLVGAQEEERTRISRELHDQMGQSLTALLMAINSMAETGAENSKSQRRLDKLKILVEELMDQAHLLAWELRPPALDNLGLRAALEQYLKEWSRSTGVRADFASRGLNNLEHLDKVVETTLYRVVQEALNNVNRHSGAELVSVLLERMDGNVTAIVEDNGHGFDVESVTSGNSERLGLIGMRERIELVGGSLTIESTPEQGTTVYARVTAETKGAETKAAETKGAETKKD